MPNVEDSMTIEEFITILSNDFQNKVVSAVELSYRENISTKLLEGVKLNEKENMKMISAINSAYYNQYKSLSPGKSVFSKLAEVLKDKLPDTYKYQTVVKTPFGNLKVKGGKGDGGSRDLALRLSSNYYDRYKRPAIKRPSSSSDSTITKKTIPKEKKIYGLNPKKWTIGITSSMSMKNEAKLAYGKIPQTADFDQKVVLMFDAEIYIQAQFRDVAPSQAAENIVFILNDPKLLSRWFEHMVNGSKHGNLAVTVEDHYGFIINTIEKYLMFKNKNDKEYKEFLETEKKNSQERFGNELWYNIILLKHLGREFKNKIESIVFVDHLDDKSNGPQEHHPNIFITKRNTLGQEDFSEQIFMSVRIGDKVLFQCVSVCQAIASLIHLYFSFNLNYPNEADDICQIFQRIFCIFGERDNARNKKGTMKKAYRDFESFCGAQMLQSDMGELKVLMS